MINYIFVKSKEEQKYDIIFCIICDEFMFEEIFVRKLMNNERRYKAILKKKKIMISDI